MLIIQQAPFVFGDMRDAIDAVSEFEAGTEEFFNYAMAYDADGRVWVTAHRVDCSAPMGFMARVEG